MEMFDIQEVLQQNPEVVQQLQRLGWVPPQLNMVPSSQSDVNLDLETLLMGPFHVVGNGLSLSSDLYLS